MSEVREGYKMTELGEIPNDWKVLNLNNVAEVIMGQSPNSNSYNELEIGLPFYQGKSEFGKRYPTPVKWCSEPTKIAEKNDVLISVRAPVGEVNICQETSCIGRGLGAIRATQKSDSLFLYYSLLLAKEALNKKGQGSTFTAINGAELKGLTLAVPSKVEQQKIASILTTVDEQIDEIEQLIVKTKDLKKGLMQQLLTKGLGHTEFKQTELGEIPIDWEIVKFSDCCSIVSGLVDPNDEVYSEYPHIGNANIEKMSGKLLDYKLVKDENLISGKFLFDERHVLYGKINPHFGKAAYPKFKGLCSADMYPIEPKTQLLIANYLIYSILDERFTKAMTANSARTGIPKVNKQEMDSYKFILPSIEEQQKIAEILSTVDEQIDVYEQEKTKYEELKKGLMQKLLTGQIRVKF